ncbi:hypothetical protein [Devosia sp.]|uniref:hypothetical protein n=1 Tax=Devosia sp. TaxID=1871048 RepID=UPI002FCC33C8
MPWLKSYGLRFVEDVAAFAGACLLSVLAALPLVVYSFGPFLVFAYAAMLLLAAASIFAVALVTAILDSYRWKFLIYVVVLGGSIFLTRDIMWNAKHPLSGEGRAVLLHVQVVFGMGIFYYLVQRRRIADRLAATSTTRNLPEAGP